MRLVILCLVSAICAATVVAKTDVLVRFDIDQADVSVGQDVTIEVVGDVSGTARLFAYGFELCFDPSVLEHASATPVDGGMSAVPILSAAGAGVSGVEFPTSMPVSGQSAVLARVTFTAIAEGVSPLDVLFTDGEPSQGFFGARAEPLDAETVPTQLTVAPDGPVALWDNGPDDGVTAFVSTLNDHTQSVVADDCWLKEGMFYDLEAAYVRMAISDGFEPDTELWFFGDCDGVPDSLNPLFVIPQESYQVIDPNPGDPISGTILYEIRYELGQFLEGEDIGWVSAVHVGEGMGFWVSANNGKVQGRQAHANAAGFGLPAWTPVDEDLCCGVCTDVYFTVEGKCCWRVLDQSNFTLTGLTDPILSQNAPWNRSYDDFQLADPCKLVDEWGICRIEAIFATNCDLTTIHGEIFDNACDTPADPVSARLQIEPTSFEQIGSPLPSGSDNLTVYRVIFSCPPGLLPTGRNYWFSIYSDQGFGAGKRSVWLFEQPQACGIRLNEALYYNPPIGFVDPTPVSDPALAGAPRDHAFSVWVCAP